MKKTMVIISFIVLCFLFVGCNSSYIEEGVFEENYNLIAYNANDTFERQIIYNVDISFDVENLDEASTFLKGLINEDEWFDQESLSANRHAYTIRIKTDRLDTFISSVKEEYTVRAYEKKGTDISLDYLDKSKRILVLESQLSRLIELYDEASLGEMLQINREISEIEVELQQLNGEIARYDSLVDYSVVNLVFYGSSVITKSPFINRVGNAFVDGFEALLSFFDGFVIVLATIFPFLVIIGLGVCLFFYIRKKNRKLKKTIIKGDKQVDYQE